MNPTSPIDPDQPVLGDSAVRQEPEYPRESETAKAAKQRAEWLPVSARLLDPETLAQVEPHVRSAVEAAGPNTVRDVQRMLRESFDLLLWTQDELGFVRPETVWHPSTIRDFVDGYCKGRRSIDSRQEARRTLQEIGRAVNERFWPERTEPLTKTGPAEPYDSQAEAAMIQAASLKGEPGRPDEPAVAGLNRPGIPGGSVYWFPTVWWSGLRAA